MTASTAGPVYIVNFTFLAFAATAVFTRLYTRLFVLKNTGLDDWLMFTALLAAGGFTTVVCFQIKYGLGIPFNEIPPEQLGKFFQSLWATIPIYNLALVLTKISIVFQYKRIFTQQNIQKLSNILIGVLIIYGTWTFFGSTFMCLPVAYFWDKTIDGHCMNQLAFWFSNAALNICTDLIVFGFPMPLLKRLQLPRNQKIGLMIIFAFGGFVCVTSIIRLKALYVISVSTDTSLDGVDAAIWSSIEINVAIGCASLPAIKPLVSRIFPRLLSVGSSFNKSKATNNSTLEYGSHTLDNLNARPHALKKEDIKIEHTIVQEREAQISRSGSDKSLVWKCDCYSEDQKLPHKPHQHV